MINLIYNQKTIDSLMNCILFSIEQSLLFRVSSNKDFHFLFNHNVNSISNFPVEIECK